MSGETTVYTWREAIQAGCDPRQYSYLPGNIPLSLVRARLDFKIWANKVIGIDGYFTMMQSLLLFQVTVYPNARYGYRTGAELIDFHTCCIAQVYLLELRQQRSGRWFLTNLLPVQQGA